MSRDEATKYKNEGNAAFKKKQWNEAIAAYTKAAEKDPSWEVPYSNRSQVYVDIFFYYLSVRSSAFYFSLSIKHGDVNYTFTQKYTHTHTQKQTHSHTYTSQALLDETVR